MNSNNYNAQTSESQVIIKKKSSLPMVIISLLLLLAVAVLFLFPNISPFSGSGKENDQVQGKGADSPEKALENYIEALADGNINAMLACCAIESVVDNMSPERQIDRAQALYPQMQIYVNDGDMMRSVNIENRRGRISTDIYRQLFSIQEKCATYDGMAVRTSDYDSIEDMIDEYFPSRTDKVISTIEIKDILEFDDVFDGSIKKQSKKQYGIYKKIYGCEEYESRIVKLKCDGEDYYLCADLAQYDSKWYICEFGGLIGSFAGIEPIYGGITEEDRLF